MAKVNIILLLTIVTLNTTWGARCNPLCARTRQLTVCRIAEEDYIWSVVDGVCRVFQNRCYFSAENCRRLSNCKCAMVSTSRTICMQSCPNFCTLEYAPVCATFPNTNTTIANDYRDQQFGNGCSLNSYACQNAIAYIGEPTSGECQSVTQ